MKDPHNYRAVGISMIVVAASLSAIALIGLSIGEDVLFADKIQRANTAVFERCWDNNDFESPECQKYKDERIFATCLENQDLESPECYKYTMQIQSAIFEECRANRDNTSPQCEKYGDMVFSGIMESEEDLE